MTDIQKIVDALGGGTKTGKEYKCKCPAHDDTNPSLYLSLGDDGRLLVKCHSGCSQPDVIAALKERGLWPESTRRESPSPRNIEWTVKSADGKYTFKHIRIDKPDGSKIVFWKPKLSANGIGTRDLQLYGIDKISDTGEVIICEGEKAADGACKLGLNGVGTVTGASSVPCDLALESLNGRKVVLWPDNDRAGYEHMCRIAERLSALGISYRFVTWPDAPHKGDAADFTGKREDFMALPLSTDISWDEPEPEPAPQRETSEKYAEINRRTSDSQATSGDISHLLMRKKNKDGSPGTIKKTAYNLNVILTEHPLLKNKIRLNERTKTMEVLPGTPVTSHHQSAIEYNDTHPTGLAIWLEDQYSISWSSAMIHEVATLVGYGNSYDPFLEYLKSLSWDNTQRAETWLIEHAGAHDNEYVRAVSKRFLISVVARTFSPGCKVDTMLILTGDQGIKKSTLFNTLVGDDFFTDNLSAIDHKDVKQDLRGPAIIEMAELDALNKKESTKIKAFITTRIDRGRDSYGRVTVSTPRRCVFVGTTNKASFLKDSTGGRRFWPVAVNGTINMQEIEKIKDQLWAEAVEWYKIGVNWWLTDDEEKLAKQAQDDVSEAGAFDDHIFNYLMVPKKNISENWWYCFDDFNVRRYLALEEIWDELKIESSQRLISNQNVTKSIERVIGGNKTVRNVVTTDKYRRKLRLYRIPDEFYQQNKITVLRSVNDSYNPLDDIDNHDRLF